MGASCKSMEHLYALCNLARLCFCHLFLYGNGTRFLATHRGAKRLALVQPTRFPKTYNDQKLGVTSRFG